LLGDPRKRIR